MSWFCPRCKGNNASDCLQCVLCRQIEGVITLKPFNTEDDYNHSDDALFKVRNHYLLLAERGTRMAICSKCGEAHEFIYSGACPKCRAKMTDHESFFLSLRNDERKTAGVMNSIELRARRDELAKIAFEARARLSEVDSIEREIRAEKGVVYDSVLDTDDVTSDAINKVKTRQAKLSKLEKAVESMVAAGIDRKTAESLVSARNVLERLKDKGIKASELAPIGTVDLVESEPAPKFTSPFKTETETETETKAATKAETADKPKPRFVSPFAKK